MRLLATALFFTSLCLAADPFPAIFPAIQGDSLTSQKVSLPDAAKGHTAIVLIGFTHASNSQLQSWSMHLEADYQPWSIVVLEDAPRLVRPMAISGIKGSVPQPLRSRFVIVVKGEKELKAAAAFDRPDDAYLLLLDPSGAIRWRFHGPFSDDALAQIKAQLKAQLAALAN